MQAGRNNNQIAAGFTQPLSTPQQGIIQQESLTQQQQSQSQHYGNSDVKNVFAAGTPNSAMYFDPQNSAAGQAAGSAVFVSQQAEAAPTKQPNPASTHISNTSGTTRGTGGSRILFVLEGTVAMQRAWPEFRGCYVEPLLRAVDRGTMGPVEMSLIVFRSRSMPTDALLDCSGWTKSVAEMRRWLDGIKFRGCGIQDTLLTHALLEAMYLQTVPSKLPRLSSAVLPASATTTDGSSSPLQPHLCHCLVLSVSEHCKLPVIHQLPKPTSGVRLSSVVDKKRPLRSWDLNDAVACFKGCYNMSFSFIVLPGSSKDRSSGALSHPMSQLYLMAWAGCSIRGELEANFPIVGGGGGAREVISAYCSTSQKKHHLVFLSPLWPEALQELISEKKQKLAQQQQAAAKQQQQLQQNLPPTSVADQQQAQQQLQNKQVQLPGTAESSVRPQLGIPQSTPGTGGTFSTPPGSAGITPQNTGYPPPLLQQQQPVAAGTAVVHPVAAATANQLNQYQSNMANVQLQAGGGGTGPASHRAAPTLSPPPLGAAGIMQQHPHQQQVPPLGNSNVAVGRSMGLLAQQQQQQATAGLSKQALNAMQHVAAPPGNAAGYQMQQQQHPGGRAVLWPPQLPQHQQQQQQQQVTNNPNFQPQALPPQQQSPWAMGLPPSVQHQQQQQQWPSTTPSPPLPNSVMQAGGRMGQQKGPQQQQQQQPYPGYQPHSGQMSLQQQQQQQANPYQVSHGGHLQHQTQSRQSVPPPIQQQQAQLQQQRQYTAPPAVAPPVMQQQPSTRNLVWKGSLSFSTDLLPHLGPGSLVLLFNLIGESSSLQPSMTQGWPAYITLSQKPDQMMQRKLKQVLQENNIRPGQPAPFTRIYFKIEAHNPEAVSAYHALASTYQSTLLCSFDLQGYMLAMLVKMLDLTQAVPANTELVGLLIPLHYIQNHMQ